MKIRARDERSVTIEFEIDELKMLAAVLVEITTGPNALDGDDWEMLIEWPRERVDALKQQLLSVIEQAQ